MRFTAADEIVTARTPCFGGGTTDGGRRCGGGIHVRWRKKRR
jgi:hypothetical protein